MMFIGNATSVVVDIIAVLLKCLSKHLWFQVTFKYSFSDPQRNVRFLVFCFMFALKYAIERRG